MILLSDGYLANGTEPWRLPDVDTLPDLSVTFATEPNHTDGAGEPVFWPYQRDPETLARAWALPGTPGLMHRIGGLEKEDGSGNISYDPANHEHMVRLRAEKVARVGGLIPPVEVHGDVDDADLLVVGWGSTWGAIDGAVARARRRGTGWPTCTSCTSTRSRRTSARCCERYPRVMVPEMNLGQLVPPAPGRVPGRRQGGHQGAGPAVHRRRARAGDHRSAEGRQS